MANQKVSSEVIDVLDRSTRIEGNILYLTCGQLDRKMYVAVNEVLDRLGGKWNRKAKGHVFEGEPTLLIEQVVETGEISAKNPTAFWPTPSGIAANMVALATRHIGAKFALAQYLEPSAGTGAILDQLFIAGVRKEQMYCIELLPANVAKLQEKGYAPDTRGGDFLAVVPEAAYDAVLMNPPFSVEGDRLAYIAHIEHAWKFVGEHGILISIAPNSLLHRPDKRTTALRKLVDQNGDIEPLEAGAFKESGTGVNTVMVTMVKS